MSDDLLSVPCWTCDVAAGQPCVPTLEWAGAGEVLPHVFRTHMLREVAAAEERGAAKERARIAAAIQAAGRRIEPPTTEGDEGWHYGMADAARIARGAS